MGLLDKLWDDTVAGPRPESGLGRLRKHSTFAFRSNSRDELRDGGSSRSYGGGGEEEEAPRITLSIVIKRPAGLPSPAGGGTPPPSSAGSTPPVSPFSGGKEWNRFRRKSSSDAYERGGGVVGEGPRSPPHDV